MNDFKAKYLQISSTYLDEKIQLLKVKGIDKKSSKKPFLFRSLFFWIKR